MLSIPEGDPVRENDTRLVLAGGDLRYLRFNTKTSSTDIATGATTTTSNDFSVPMAADVGVQVKPTRHVSIVIEARFMNGPSGTDSRSEWDNVFEPISSPSQALGRSAYIMVDDLEYNTYFIYGLFRPMFGYYDPDHTNLYNRLSYGQNASMKAVAKGVTFGTADNTPYANISLIQPTATTLNQNTGAIVNIGAHFGNFGMNASYWNTKSSVTTTVEATRRMTALGLSGMWGSWIASLDMNRILRDRNDAGMDAGTVFQILNRIKLWRETYLILNYFNANVAADLSLGSSSESQIGFRSFLLSGVDLELLSSQLKDKTATKDSVEDRLSFQMHLYF